MLHSVCQQSKRRRFGLTARRLAQLHNFLRQWDEDFGSTPGRVGEFRHHPFAVSFALGPFADWIEALEKQL